MGEADITNKTVLDAIMRRFDAFEALKVAHTELKARVDTIDRQQVTIVDELCFLSSELAESQQAPLAANATLRGIPETENIDSHLLSAVKLVLKKCLPGAHNSVVSVERIGRLRKEEKGRPIVIKFIDSEKQKEVIKAFRNHPPTLADITFNDKTTAGTSNDKLYLNDQLGRINSRVYYNARKLLKTGAVKFVWCTEGRIFVRKAEGEPAFKISHITQLAKFIPSTKPVQPKEPNQAQGASQSQNVEKQKPKHLRNNSGGGAATRQLPKA